MARPTKINRKPTFFWQGLLILLPVMALAGFGLSFLRQDKRLAENEAKERAQILADDLSASFSNNFFENLSRLYFDSVNAKINQHEDRGINTYFLVQASLNASKDVVDVNSPLRPEILKNWPEAAYGSLWSYRGIKLDAEGRLAAVGCKMNERGEATYSGAVRPGVFAQTPRPLARATLSETQKAAWDRARNEEFSATDPQKAIEAYGRFLALSPSAGFEAAAQYATGALLAKEGQNAKAEALFRKLEGTTNLTTEAGLPMNLLAQLQRLQLERSEDMLAGLWMLCSNAISQPSGITPLILDRARELEGKAGLKEPEASWLWFGAWDTDEGSRDFYEQNLHEFRPELMRDRVFWTTWRDRNWLVMVEGIDTFDENSQPHATGYYGLSVFPELLVQEAAWEVNIASPMRVPEYASVSLNLAGRNVPVATNSPVVLAEATAKLNLDYHVAEGLTVRILLDRPAIFYAHQRLRALWLGSLIGVAALAALAGFVAARHAFTRQLHLSEMKSNFVSSVSHELRAPIASVRLMAEGLERGRIQAPEKQQEYFHFIVQECRRLSSLIENVLDFSRIEQGRKQYELESTDLAALTKQTVALMETYAAEQQIGITLSVTGEPVPMELDGKAIQQALINLIDNAIKHSPKGATVSVGVEFGKAAGGEHPEGWTPNKGCTPNGVRLWVEDKGEGITAAEHEKIFERFYRVGSELRRQTQGVGIGLSIVKHIVEAHGGRVVVRSVVGEGSRFTIELPAPSPPPG